MENSEYNRTQNSKMQATVVSSPLSTKLRTWIIAAFVFAVLGLAVSMLSAQIASAQNTGFNQNRAFLEDEQNTIDIVQAIGDSVVAIRVESPAMESPFGNLEDFEGQIPEQFRDFFRLPSPDDEGNDDENGEDGNSPEFDLDPQPDIGTGSGFVIDSAGLIITNYHVIADAIEEDSVDFVEGGKISVIFPNTNEEELDVRVVGANPSFDMALLELIDQSQLPASVMPIAIANSDEVLVGQKVIAIGNPFGFSSTVTTGIVSALDRDQIRSNDLLASMIQTDAAINPGNSGGPLLNSRGELIGINTAIIPGGSALGGRGNIGVGFAVPSNLLSSNLSGLKAGGVNDVFSTRPRIGIGIWDFGNLPDEIKETLGYPDRGVVITGVEEDGPADKAGLLGPSGEVMIQGQSIPTGGDVIVAIDGIEVYDTAQLQDIVFSHVPGDQVIVTVLRNDQLTDVTVTLEIVPRN